MGMLSQPPAVKDGVLTRNAERAQTLAEFSAASPAGRRRGLVAGDDMIGTLCAVLRQGILSACGFECLTD